MRKAGKERERKGKVQERKLVAGKGNMWKGELRRKRKGMRDVERKDEIWKEEKICGMENREGKGDGMEDMWKGRLKRRRDRRHE